MGCSSSNEVKPNKKKDKKKGGKDSSSSSSEDSKNGQVKIKIHYLKTDEKFEMKVEKAQKVDNFKKKVHQLKGV